MSKEKILEVLKRSDDFVSGQKLADELNVSRNTVWKQIRSLQDEGHVISSKTNAGYRLEKSPDRLSPSEILRLTGIEENKLIFFEEIGSTNNYLKDNHEKFEDHTIVLSDQQTAGRGRFGKSFHSPKNNGIYFSILYKGNRKPEPEFLTLASALAVSDVMQSYELDPRIKWVNDVYLDGLKISGILTEGEIELETGAMKYLIVGIGLNVNNEEFPDELASIAGSMKGVSRQDYDLNEVLARLLGSLEQYTSRLIKDNRSEAEHQTSVQEILRAYEKRLLFRGETVTLSGGNREDIKGELLGIDDKGHLMIRNEDGITSAVYGEYQLTAR